MTSLTTVTTLNYYQQKALDLVKKGHNVFITGPAGSGKSTLISHITHELRNIHRKNVAVTALTGCASLLLGTGTKTLHSWAGIGLGNDDVPTLIHRIRKTGKTVNWIYTNTLIIDEISMMTCELFEKLDQIARILRSQLGGSQLGTLPFGGLQLILCGDFFQLPPVSSDKYLFESDLWNNISLQTVYLHTIERQSDDKEFQYVLNNIRYGFTDDHINKILQSRMNLDWKSLLIRPTLLYPKNADVQEINHRNILSLQKPLRTFMPITVYRNIITDFPTSVNNTTEIDINHYDQFKHIFNRPGFNRVQKKELENICLKLDKDANYSTELALCEGAQVMLIVNLSIHHGLVNGSRGVITHFNDMGYPVVEFINGRRILIEPHVWFSSENPHFGRKQIPLIVAYAITIHKCQGTTLDRALVDIGDSIFEHGQAYVALSRVKNLNSLYIHKYNPYKIKTNKKVIDYYYDIQFPLATPAWNRRKFAITSLFL